MKRPTRGQPARRLLTAALCALLGSTLGILPACVNVDPKTGKTIPRGNQRYEFSKVEKNAKQLEPGMGKTAVLMLLGSPAEKSADGDTWVYLPERPAVLVPSRALRLVFEQGQLSKHGYRPIILGQDL